MRLSRAALLFAAPAVILIAGSAFVVATHGDTTPTAAAGHYVVHANGIARDGTPDPPTPTPSPTPTPTVVRPTSAQGLRIWADGDSTSYFVSVAFLALMQQQGAVPVQPAAVYQVSSGLMNPGFFDWPSYIASEMAATNPDVVLFMLGANDAVGAPDTETYRARVAAVMDELRAPGRTVLWMGQPHMGTEPSGRNLSSNVDALNQVFAQEAAKRPWVIYVDTWALTSDADGNYAQYLPDENGVVHAIRGDDGIHLTSEGGRRLALAAIRALFPS
jgi:hypothetical protein